jgi:hypothetical protein
MMYATEVILGDIHNKYRDDWFWNLSNIKLIISKIERLNC